MSGWDLLFCFFLLSFLIQCIYWGYFVRKLLSQRAEDSLPSGHFPPVSVVICARNEEQNLRNGLPLILGQDYPRYEVVIVNHQSTDNTREFISELRNHHDNLVYVECQEPVTSKRPALLLGLAKSRYDHILVTDGDCKPVSSKWISLMTRPLSEGFEIVVGAAPLTGNGHISCFVRHEAALIYLQYATATLCGFSYMGVGRNMAYRKELYLKYSLQDRFSYISGDDDLFISTSQSQNIALVSDPEAAMHSGAAKSWREFYHRKHRHVSVSWAYHHLQKLYLAGFSVSHWGFLIFFLLQLSGPYLIPGLLLYFFKSGANLYLMRRLAQSFIANCSSVQLLIAELLYLVHYPVVALYLSKKPPRKW